MLFSADKIVKYQTCLLNLAVEPGQVSKAC